MVEFLMAPHNEETTGTLLDCVKHVKNIPVRGGGKDKEELWVGEINGGREGGN